MIIVTTVPTRALAVKMARKLLQDRRIASAQISGPLESHYRWKGKVKKAREWTLSLRTTASQSNAVQNTIVELHPYELPEILEFKFDAAKDYLAWIKECCR